MQVLSLQTARATRTSILHSVPTCLEHFSGDGRSGNSDSDTQSEDSQHQLRLVKVITENVESSRRRRSSPEQVEACRNDQGSRFEQRWGGDHPVDARDLVVVTRKDISERSLIEIIQMDSRRMYGRWSISGQGTAWAGKALKTLPCLASKERRASEGPTSSWEQPRVGPGRLRLSGGKRNEVQGHHVLFAARTYG